MHVQTFDMEGSQWDESLDPKVTNLLKKMGLSNLNDLTLYSAENLTTNWCGTRVLLAVRHALQCRNLKLKGD